MESDSLANILIGKEIRTKRKEKREKVCDEYNLGVRIGW